MSGGGGGGDYDDTWIRNWTTDAQAREKVYKQQIDNLGTWNQHRMGEIGALTEWNKHRMQENQTQAAQIGDLTTWNQHRMNEIGSLQGDVSGLSRSFADLEKLVNAPTAVGDVTGLDNIISNLQSQYSSADSAIGDLSTQLSTTEESIRGDTKTQLEKAISDLGINQFMGDMTFEEAMNQRLGSLQDTISGDFGSEIKRLNLDTVSDSLKETKGNLSALGLKFGNLSEDVELFKNLDLGGFDDRLTAQGATIRDEFKGDLTDLQEIIKGKRGEDLRALEDKLGKDRTADILQLKEDVESGRASAIETLAGNLRQEYGDKIFDLTDTFDTRYDTLQSDLGSDISNLFTQQGDLRKDLEGGLDTLTSGLGTTSQQLEALRDSFGDYQTQAASNLGDVRSALESEIGDVQGALTSGLADLQTDYVDRILGAEKAGLTALASEASAREAGLATEAAARESGLATEAAARESGLATEAAAREAGLATEAASRESGLATEAAAREAGLQSAQSERTRLAEEASRGFQDVYKTREQAIADLSGRFGENLRAQEESLGRRIDDSSRAFDEKIGRLGSMMNYRMLGDSAGGVKMRRSKAYKSGAINTGTGQLSRSMKLKTLNI